MAILGVAVVAGSCGDQTLTNTASGAASTVVPTTSTSITLDLPTGTGLFIDPSLTREEFDQILRNDGYNEDQLIKDDAVLIDVRVDEPFVSLDDIVGEPHVVHLVGGYVMVDGVAVVMYEDGTNACYAPVGGSTEVRNGIVYVAMFSGFKKGIDECIARTDLWRATLVVPDAKYGMAVRQQGSDTTLDGVSAPLVENLPASLIFPDELPPAPN